MTLKDIDTSRLLYDIKSADFVEKIKNKIPVFKEYKGKIPEKKIFSYIILMYDINSEFWRSVLDYYERKRVCAELVEFKKVKGKWTQEVEDVLIGKNEEANTMIVEYIAQFGLPELYQLVGHLSLLGSETRKTISFKGNKDSLRILKEAGDEISRLTRIVFHSGDYDEITSARNALYAKAEKERIKLRPEDVVKLISEEGQLPDDFNPYGEGYMPEKSKFLGDEEPD